MKLNGKGALVIDSSQGIGQAIAIRLAQEETKAEIDIPPQVYRSKTWAE